MDTAKQRIIEVAGPIFAQKGFNSTTVREICSAAKVNHAAINYYFGNKENLYKEIVASIVTSMTPWNQETELSPPVEGISFEERLRALIFQRASGVFACELSQWKIQLMLREIHDPTPICGRRLLASVAEDYQKFYRFLDEYFTPETSDDLRWKFIFLMLGTLVHYKASDWLVRELVPESLRQEHFQAEHIASFIVDAFLAASKDCRRTETTGKTGTTGPGS